MKLAIMQPYFFPYIGYFQLVHAVDAFVVYDDVNFINRGWINRNYVLSQGNKVRITLQLKGSSQNLLINQIAIGGNRQKLLSTIQQSYARSAYYSEVFPLIAAIMSVDLENLGSFLNFGLRRTCEYLDILPEWYLSSELKKEPSLRGQEKILAICKELGADHYINLEGGRELYDHASFDRAGVQLSFIEPGIIEYQQSGNEFVPYLSIIDVMMFNGREQSERMLEEYRID